MAFGGRAMAAQAASEMEEQEVTRKALAAPLTLLPQLYLFFDVGRSVHGGSWVVTADTTVPFSSLRGRHV